MSDPNRINAKHVKVLVVFTSNENSVLVGPPNYSSIETNTNGVLQLFNDSVNLDKRTFMT